MRHQWFISATQLTLLAICTRLKAASIVSVLMFALCVKSQVAIMHVQGAPSTDNTNTATTTTVASGASAMPTTTGNAIVLRVAYQATTQTVQNCTDTGGSAFQKVAGQMASISGLGLAGMQQEIWLAKSIVGHAANVVTCTFTASLGGAFAEITWEEMSGVSASSPIDGAASCNAGISLGTDSVTSGNITTTIAGDVIWTAAVVSGTVIPSSGFIERSHQNLDSTEDTFQWAPGVVAGTFTPIGRVSWIACAVALAPGGPLPGTAGIVHVQGAPQIDNSTGNADVSISSKPSPLPTSTGNTIIARVAYQATAQTVQSCTDSAGNTFQRVAGPATAVGTFFSAYKA